MRLFAKAKAPNPSHKALKPVPIKQIHFAAKNTQSESRITPGLVVAYEHHAKINLGLTIAEKGGKWRVLNPQGAELLLPVARLSLLPDSAPDSLQSTASRTEYLEKLYSEALELSRTLELEDAWTLLRDETNSASVSDITSAIRDRDSNLNQFAVRVALSEDSVFFKRKKQGYEPREPEVVEELKIKAKVEREKQEKRERLFQECMTRLHDKSAPLPNDIELLAQASVFGNSAAESKELRDIIERIVEKADLGAGRRLEEKAFQLLVRMGFYSVDENLLPRKLGRPISFSKEEEEEAEKLADFYTNPHDEDRLDLRSVLTLTIDGDDTKDFDDALSVEQTESGYRLGVHISDVASVLPEDSLVAAAGIRRGTSIYCPDEQFPMLPEKLSEGALSLREGQDRLALSFLIEVDSAHVITNRELRATIINVDHRLTYDTADAILYGETNVDASLHDTLSYLWDIAGHSEVRRVHNGALQLNRREQTPVVNESGLVTLIDANEDKPSRKLVSELMILANETAALFGQEHQIPLVYRSQEAPEQDPEEATAHIPEGPGREYHKRSVLKRSIVSYQAAPHAGLGLSAYTQVTSPIRRAGDLVNQRQLLHFLSTSEARYEPKQLMEILGDIEGGLEEAGKIQRGRTRYWLLKYLAQEKIREINAVVVKIDGPKPLAELEKLCMIYPFHPKQKKQKSEQRSKYELGDAIKLRVDSLNPRSDTLVLREV